MTNRTTPHTLSVVIATHNEEANISATLESIKDLADEIIVADGESTDATVSIAKSFGAKVIPMTNKKMFHLNKQAAGEKATGEWILYLDADEIIPKELADEIRTVIAQTHSPLDLSQHKLFRNHMRNIAARGGIAFDTHEPINGYFIARKNYFLGTYLMHSGVYPDGVIRLVRNGKAYWPCKDVHETMVVEGGVSWLAQPLIHMADPTFRRYLQRANRYTTLTALHFKNENISTGLPAMINYLVWMPVKTFLMLFFRHRGFLDGFSGFVWALMSGLHFSIAYLKYIEMKK